MPTYGRLRVDDPRIEEVVDESVMGSVPLAEVTSLRTCRGVLAEHPLCKVRSAWRSRRWDSRGS